MKWVECGDGVEVLTRAMCIGCQELKRRLAEAGIAFRELDVATLDGRAAAAWYGDPGLLPAVAIDGRLIESNGDVDALFQTVTRLAKEEHHE
mgnify:CR=1 FL=1